MRLVQTVITLFFLASACSSANLVITDNVGNTTPYPGWLPEQLKIEALNKATFELLWEPGEFQFIRAHIPWKRDRFFIAENGRIIDEQTSLNKSLNAYQKSISIEKEKLPYQLRNLNADAYHVLHNARGCNLIRASGSFWVDELFIVRSTIRSVKQFPTKDISSAWQYFNDYVQMVDYRVTVVKNQAEVKEKPSDTAFTVAYVNQGRTLVLESEVGEWKKVLLDDSIPGYIRSSVVSEGKLVLEPGKLSIIAINWKLYEGDKLVPAFTHLYGATEFQGLSELDSEPSVGRSLLAYGQQSGNDLAKGLGLVMAIAEAGQDRENLYAFSRLEVENLGDLPLDFTAEIGLPDLARPARATIHLEGGKRTEIDLTPKFDETIFQIREQTPKEAYCEITDNNGRIIERVSKDIVVLSRNDMVWHFDSGFDATPLFAAFVTPRAPFMSSFLRMAAEYSEGKAIGGYQMKAVFDALSSLDVKYVSTTISFGGQQRISFPAEVLKEKSGNCIDLSLFYASVFEAMGMEPVVVLVPGHAFIGVRSSSGSKQVYFLETTMTHYGSFEAAVQKGTDTFNKYQDENNVLVIDINKCRELGVTPAPISLI